MVKTRLSYYDLKILSTADLTLKFDLHHWRRGEGASTKFILGRGSPHSLVSWDLGQGGAAGRTFAPSATDIHKGYGSRIATGRHLSKVDTLSYIRVAENLKIRLVLEVTAERGQH